MKKEVVVSMRNISKEYPGVLANDRVNFDLAEGEIHGLLGENGAGKSTLMKILYGMEQPTEGDIYIRGIKTAIDTPKSALEQGIGMVHQHFMLIKNFSVAINVTLGMTDRLGYRLDERRAIHLLQEFYSEMTYFKVDPKGIIEELPVGIQQRVEILKILFRGAKILILDEPTAVLTPNETQELFDILKRFTKDGYSIIFISHKLDEIMELTDRVTVMRDGRVIGEVNTKETSKEELARMMVGREVIFRLPKTKQQQGAPVLSVDKLTVDTDWGRAVNKLSFSVHKGEILGIAGVDGNGQKELVEAIVGLRAKTSGVVMLQEQDITNTHPHQFNRECSYIPEDRQEEGLIMEYSIADNLILKNHNQEPFSKHYLLDKEIILNHANQLIEDYRIKTPNAQVMVKALSGGNQQKVVVSREMSKDPDLLIAVNPTRGIDVGSIEEIQVKLLKHRDEGKAILLVSTELEEILSLSDRIAVLYEGEFMGIVSPDTPVESIGLMMAGTRHRGEGEQDDQ